MRCHVLHILPEYIILCLIGYLVRMFAMSRRMQQRMRLLQQAAHTTPTPGGETDAYSDLMRHAGGSLQSVGPEKYREGLQGQFGMVYLPERAPYGMHGYALYRIGANRVTEYLCAGSPYHGHQIPLVWADYDAARRLAAQLGCSVAYASRSDGVCAVGYLRDHDVARFGNKGVPVKVPRAVIGDMVMA